MGILSLPQRHPLGITIKIAIIKKLQLCVGQWEEGKGLSLSIKTLYQNIILKILHYFSHFSRAIKIILDICNNTKDY